MISKTFRETVFRYGLIAPGDKVLAACSGGPDSMALLDLLLELRKTMPLEVAVAHFNHGLRAAAGEDERFVGEFSRSRGLAFMSGRRDVRGFAVREGLNLEEAGRSLRYGFLRRAALSAGAGKIATGHTLTDQAETFLMRILRGTGRTGLAGIAPATMDGIIRPLLGVEREDVEAYLRAKKIPFRRDATNLDRRLLRNRVRLELLPMLKRRFDPRIVRHLGRLALLLSEEEFLLDRLTEDAAGGLIGEEAGRISLDARRLQDLPGGLARRVVREYVRRLRGDLRGVTYEDVEAVLSLAEGKVRAIRKGLFLGREAGKIRVENAEAKAVSFRRLWDGRKDLVLKQPGFRFHGRFIRKGRPLPAWDDRTRACLDLGEITLPLLVRSPRPGDRYRPLGAPGRKKLMEVLRSRGVRREERERLPVFVSAGNIIWVPGCPVADSARVRKSTTSVLVIEVAARIPGA